MELLRRKVKRLFLILLVVHCSSASYFIAAPNLLRVGVEETVSISVFNTDKQVHVKLSLQDFPNRQKTFSQVEGTFTSLLPGKLNVKVNANDLPNSKSLDKQYVYLKASSATPGFQFNDEIKILVSFRNAIVLVQTEKPIYKPGEEVSFRVIPLDLNMKASLKNVTIEVLNPQGIRVKRWVNENTDAGFFTRKIELPEHTLLGNWTVVTLYGHGLVQNTSVKFEVREYVLPKFSVKVKGPEYICEGDSIIPVHVESKYTYGKGVQGSAYINLAVLDDAGKTETFSKSVHMLTNGKALLTLKTDVLKNHPKKLWFPDGKRLSMEVKVIEDVTGQQETVLDNSVPFTKSPLKISFKRTVWYFKPGFPYDIKVDVSYMNGKPAKGIDVILDAKTDSNTPLGGQIINKDTTDGSGHVHFVINLPRDEAVQYLVIKATATIQRGGVDLTSENSFQPVKYQSRGKNYLSVTVPKCKVGSVVHARTYVHTATKVGPSSLSYLIISRGRIVDQGKRSNINEVPTISLRITPEMTSGARFIAYYIVNNEIVVDSVVMDVEERFPNQIKMKFVDDPAFPCVRPGSNCMIEMDTKPFSYIGVMAVDQSVYLLRDDKQLTQDKVLHRLKSHDLGCGFGGGKNNKDVLAKAGLAVMADVNNLKSDPRTEEECSAASRRRRRSTDPSQTKCCQLGEVRDPRSCLVRGREFLQTTNVSFHIRMSCAKKFYGCCKQKFESDARARSISHNQDDRLLEGNVDPDLDFEANVRRDFPESFLFIDDVAGKDGKLMLPFTTPGSITTWVIQGISVSNQTGFGLAPPLHLKAFKKLFISLSMPYSAQRGEQVSLIATVFNYAKEEYSVSVYLSVPENNDFCSYVEAGTTRTIYKTVVKPDSAESVSFPIVPTVVGEIPIQVNAYMVPKDGPADAYVRDSEERVLNVVPEGMERRQTYSVVLDPLDILRDPSAPKPVKPANASKLVTSSKRNGVQMNEIKLTLPKSAVPFSPSASFSVIGNLIGPAVSDVIEGRGLHAMIQLPTHCGEQTMLTLAPNVFVLEYLRTTKQVTPKIEETAYNYIRSGYERELTFRRTDNSFSAFGNDRDGSTWLTAFVIKTFCAIQKLNGVDIDENVICSAITWLLSIQRADGAIPEQMPVVHQEMNGDINGEIAMTAYVVTALLECKCQTQDTQQTLKKAVTFLENNRAKIGRVYVKAVVAYALALASSPQKDAANAELLQQVHYDADKNTRYWTDGGNAINVETTSYALLTQLVLKRNGYSGPIVVWLTEQRKGGGGFVSTQDTCVALQALSAYSQATSGNALDLTVILTTNVHQNYRKTLFIKRQNALVQQSIDISDFVNGQLFVQTKGSGVGQLQVELRYNTPAHEREACQFNLTVTTAERVKKLMFDPPSVRRRRKRSGPKKGRGGKKGRRGHKGKGRKKAGQRKHAAKRVSRAVKVPNSISFEICTRYRKAGQVTGMSILDVGILTGFSVKKDTIEKLKKNLTLGIAKVELSDRHAIFYLDKIPSASQLCFTLEMERGFEVGLLQAAPVTVYDYYEPDNKCTEFYGPKSTSPLSLASCDKDACRCSVDTCTSSSPSGNIQTVVRQLCHDYDFAIMVQVLSLDDAEGFVQIKSDVKEVLKKSSTKPLHAGDRLTLMKQPKCLSPAIGGKQVDHRFLIMGMNAGLAHRELMLDYRVYVREAPMLPKRGRASKFYRNVKKLARRAHC